MIFRELSRMLWGVSRERVLKTSHKLGSAFQ
jgi:hypothetical protein